MRRPLETAAWRGRRGSAEGEALSYRHCVKAGAAGIFEPFVDLGERVRAGEAVGQIHDPDRPARAPSLRKNRVAGILYARHAFGPIRKTDIVAIVARETKCW